MDFIDPRTILIITHLLGVALGAGGAYMSDIIFFYSMRDHTLTRAELRFMSIGSKIVWTGVALLVLSGLGLFSLSPAEYLGSYKFLAKMTIVSIVVVNGFIFHSLHFPYLRKHSDLYLHKNHTFHSKSIPLFISGAISGVSWTSAIILGALRSVTVSYTTIMLIYFCIVTLAICASLGIRTWHRGLADRNP